MKDIEFDCLSFGAVCHLRSGDCPFTKGGEIQCIGWDSLFKKTGMRTHTMEGCVP